MRILRMRNMVVCSFEDNPLAFVFINKCIFDYCCIDSIFVNKAEKSVEKILTMHMFVRKEEKNE